MVKVPSLYKLDYEAADEMRRFDGEQALRRWFDNWKIDREAHFAADDEWLTIEERKFRGARRTGVRYIGTICDVEELGPRRAVVFETNAPPPPTFHRPAKIRPEPPRRRARDSNTLTVDTIYEAMDRLGIGRAERRDLMREYRSPWHLMGDLRIREAVRQTQLEGVRMSTFNWLTTPGGIVTGLDLAEAKPVTPVLPPKRYRRNA
jgi:hypothetical protein